MEDSAALAGGIAAVLSALATFAGMWLARRAQRNTDQDRDTERRKEYLGQLQTWSADIYAEKDRMLDQAREDCERRIAELTREWADRTRAAGERHQQALRDLEVRLRAQLFSAQAREDYYRRAAEGGLRPGERPPP